MARRRRRLWLIVALLVLIVLAQFTFFQPARDVARRFLAVPASAISSVTEKVRDNIALLRSIRQIARENAELREQNTAQLAQIAQLSNVKNENAQLREDLNFSQQRPDLTLLPATIINYSPVGSYRAVVIDKGSQDGIKEGQAVVSSGFLVGKVHNVSQTSAEVWLLANRNLLTPVILTNSQVTGILKGGIRGLVVDSIPVDTQVSSGELVVTSALEGLYPAGLAVGTIEEVISEQEEIFVAVRISSPVNIANIRTLFVVK